jgi:hypothetical protein
MTYRLNSSDCNNSKGAREGLRRPGQGSEKDRNPVQGPGQPGAAVWDSGLDPDWGPGRVEEIHQDLKNSSWLEVLPRAGVALGSLRQRLLVRMWSFVGCFGCFEGFRFPGRLSRPGWPGFGFSRFYHRGHPAQWEFVFVPVEQ